MRLVEAWLSPFSVWFTDTQAFVVVVLLAGEQLGRKVSDSLTGDLGI